MIAPVKVPPYGPGRRHIDPVDLVTFVAEELVRAGWTRVAVDDLAVALDAADHLLTQLGVPTEPRAVLADELLADCGHPGMFPGDGPCGCQVTVSTDAAGRLVRTCRHGHRAEQVTALPNR